MHGDARSLLDLPEQAELRPGGGMRQRRHLQRHTYSVR